MLNLNKPTKIKLKPKPTLTFKNCSYVCAYHCVQLSYTTQNRTVLIIFPLILQTIIIAQICLLEGRMDGSGISWTICKSLAPRFIEITTPALHHSIFYKLDALPDTHPTVSKALKANKAKPTKIGSKHEYQTTIS